MKINFNNIFTDLSGDELQDGDKIQKETAKLFKAGMSSEDVNKRAVVMDHPLKLSSVCARSLLTENKDSPLAGDEKIERYKLAARIMDNTDSITPEEASLIRNCIADTYSVLIVGQAWEWLDPQEE